MKYAKIKKYDVANGTGVRISFFVSGCNHHCHGCFNQDAWDFSYGETFTTKTINNIINYLSESYIEGLSILGGEPMERANQNGVLSLIKKVKEIYPNKNIWLYSGFTYEQLIKMPYPETQEILNNIEVLVDGKFDEKLFDANLYFRGSSNQRIIDMRKTITNGKIILHEMNKKKELLKNEN